MIKNSISAAQPQKMSFSVLINQPNYQQAIINALQDRETAKRFTASMVSAVTSNPALAKCEPISLISAGLLGESLKLSPSPQLGHYYFVPFKVKGIDVAQFQLGYKGYIQLATRSGQYRKLTVLPIKQGELINFNPLEEEIQVNLILNEVQRETTPTAGYYAMFEYVNGFKKAMYWSREKMQSHALKYSAGYRSDANKGTAYTFWSKDFDGMACKTMLRQLIGKWGVMSVDFQRAYESDMGVISENGTVDYIDNPAENKTPESIGNAPHVQPESPPQQIAPPVGTPVPEKENDFTTILEGFKS